MIRGHFVGYPEHWDCKPPGPDGRAWMIQNPEGKFGFQVHNGPLIIPPDGFFFDGASVPRMVWPLIGPPTGYGPKANYMPAAALHDLAYVRKLFSRKVCDQLMLAAMRALHVSRWRRAIMFTALRIGGDEHYGRDELDFP